MALQEALDKIEREKADAIAARETAEKAQKTAEEKLAKAGTHNTHTNKEKKNMATGTASESDLSLADQQTIARAASLLETMKGRPTVDAALAELRGAGEGEGDDDDSATMLEKIETSLTDMSLLRAEVAKSESPNPLQRERVEKTHRDLELAYLQRVSGAHQGWRGEELARMRKVEGGVAA